MLDISSNFALNPSDEIGISSRPTLMGFDGDIDWENLNDTLQRFTGGKRVEEYIDACRPKQALLTDLKDKLHERFRCNYFYSAKNKNVDAGLNFIAKLMCNKATTGWTHMNAGTGSGATTSGMTDLVTPLTPRLPVSGRFDSYNVAYHTCYYSVSDGNGSGTAIWLEIAPFTAITAGIMLGRFVVPAYTKTPTKSAQIVYSTTLTAT